jgi:hypothetical protein
MANINAARARQHTTTGSQPETIEMFTMGPLAPSGASIRPMASDHRPDQAIA